MTFEKEHEQVQELLPWYVNDTLAGKDSELVLKHLADCGVCQEERDRLYQLQLMVQESDSPTPGYDMSFRRVMQRIDSAERDKRSTLDVDQFAQSSRLFPMGIAASVLLVLLAGGAWFNNATRSGDEFQTLSTDLSSKGSGQRMELGFVSPIPATTMRQALIDTNSNIVSGPDQDGNYLVEVVVPNHMSNDEYLNRIQKIEGVKRVRFIEN